MNAEELINLYKTEYSIERIEPDEYPRIKRWLENELQKNMTRPFYMTQGKGGGQRYRLWWLIFDVLGNRNTPTYFFTDMNSTSRYLIEHGHLPLQDWIDDQSQHLMYTPL